MSKATSWLGPLASADIGSLIVKGVAILLIIGTLYVLLGDRGGTAAPVTPDDVAANLEPIGSIAVVPPPNSAEPEPATEPEPAATAAKPEPATEPEPAATAAKPEPATEPEPAATDAEPEPAIEPKLVADPNSGDAQPVASEDTSDANTMAPEQAADSNRDQIAAPVSSPDPTSTNAEIEPVTAGQAKPSTMPAAEASGPTAAAQQQQPSSLPPSKLSSPSNTYSVPIAPRSLAPSRPIPTWGPQFSPMPPTR